MDIPEYLQKEVDRVLTFHEIIFRNAAQLFETETDMHFIMETLMIDTMGIHNRMKVKHIIILFAIGQALVAKGFEKDKVKKCQIEILRKYYYTEEQKTSTVFEHIVTRFAQSVFDEIYALISNTFWFS